VEQIRKSAEGAGESIRTPSLLVGRKAYCAQQERIYFYIPDNKGKNQKRFVKPSG